MNCVCWWCYSLRLTFQFSTPIRRRCKLVCEYCIYYPVGVPILLKHLRNTKLDNPIIGGALWQNSNKKWSAWAVTTGTTRDRLNGAACMKKWSLVATCTKIREHCNTHSSLSNRPGWKLGRYCGLWQTVRHAWSACRGLLMDRWYVKDGLLFPVGAWGIPFWEVDKKKPPESWGSRGLGVERCGWC